MYISIERERKQGTWIRLTRQVAVIGLADLERRALRGRSRVRLWGCKITEQEKGRDGKAGAVLVEDPGELE
jgi:hypothetical protein